jgi:uncharacterized membrane protein
MRGQAGKTLDWDVIPLNRDDAGTLRKPDPICCVTPSMLREYDEVLPGLANRIVTMAETQSKHRIRLESRVTTSNIWRGHLGQIFAFLIAIAGIMAGTYLILHDKPVEGLVAILGPIGGIAGVFVWGKRKQSQELASKNRTLERR